MNSTMSNTFKRYILYLVYNIHIYIYVYVFGKSKYNNIYNDKKILSALHARLIRVLYY